VPRRSWLCVSLPAAVSPSLNTGKLKADTERSYLGTVALLYAVSCWTNANSKIPIPFPACVAIAHVALSPVVNLLTKDGESHRMPDHGRQRGHCGN